MRNKKIKLDGIYFEKKFALNGFFDSIIKFTKYSYRLIVKIYEIFKYITFCVFSLIQNIISFNFETKPL